LPNLRTWWRIKRSFCWPERAGAWRSRFLVEWSDHDTDRQPLLSHVDSRATFHCSTNHVVSFFSRRTVDVYRNEFFLGSVLHSGIHHINIV